MNEKFNWDEFWESFRKERQAKKKEIRFTKPLSSFSPSILQCLQIIFLPKINSYASCTYDRKIVIWDFDESAKERKFIRKFDYEAHNSSRAENVEMDTLNGEYIVSTDGRTMGSCVCVFNTLFRKRKLFRLGDLSRRIHAIQLSKKWFVCSEDAKISIRGLKKGKEISKVHYYGKLGKNPSITGLCRVKKTSEFGFIVAASDEEAGDFVVGMVSRKPHRSRKKNQFEMSECFGKGCHTADILYLDTFLHKSSSEIVVTVGRDEVMVLWSIDEKKMVARHILAYSVTSFCIRSNKYVLMSIRNAWKGKQKFVLWDLEKDSTEACIVKEKKIKNRSHSTALEIVRGGFGFGDFSFLSGDVGGLVTNYKVEFSTKQSDELFQQDDTERRGFVIELLDDVEENGLEKNALIKLSMYGSSVESFKSLMFR